MNGTIAGRHFIELLDALLYACCIPSTVRNFARVFYLNYIICVKVRVTSRRLFISPSLGTTSLYFRIIIIPYTIIEINLMQGIC